MTSRGHRLWRTDATDATASATGGTRLAYRRSAQRGDRLLACAMVRDTRWALILTAAFAADVVVALALPAVLARAVDAAITRADAVVAVAYAVVLMGVGALAELLAALAGPHMTASGRAWLRHSLMRHALSLGLRGQRRFPPGDLVSRLLDGAGEAAAVGPLLVGSATSLVTSVGAVVALGLIDWRLAAVFALVVPYVLLVIRAYVRSTSHAAARYQEVQGEIAARLVDALGGVRTIRASATRDQEVDRVLEPLPRLAHFGHRLWHAQRHAAWWSRLLSPLMQAAILGTAGYGVLQGRLTPGEMLAAVGYAALALGLLRQVGTLLALAEARGAAGRAAEMLEEPVPTGGTHELPDGPGELVFRGVAVHREGRPLLGGLDLVIPGGSAVAVVGPSGAGKTTLGALAGRLIDPDEGRVWLDGVPLDMVDPVALRSEVAYAFEQPALLGETVADAIGYGDRAVSRAMIERAAKIARADAFVRRLPDGYDTPLADAPMSGGEAQRLGLARAAAHGGRLLVLDDATSSLDTATEAQVGDAIDDAFAGRTRLVIAQRAATAARADLVAWLDDRGLRAVASHAALWGDPAYRAVFAAAQPPAEGGKATCDTDACT